jgi:DNA-binding NtrC family response regulator
MPLSPEQVKRVLDSLSEGVCTVWTITSFNAQPIHEGRRQETAARLGFDPATLWRKMKRRQLS